MKMSIINKINKITTFRTPMSTKDITKSMHNFGRMIVYIASAVGKSGVPVLMFLLHEVLSTRQLFRVTVYIDLAHCRRRQFRGRGR